MCAPLAAQAALAQATTRLTKVELQPQPGNQIEVKLVLDGPAPQPVAFTIDTASASFAATAVEAGQPVAAGALLTVDGAYAAQLEEKARLIAADRGRVMISSRMASSPREIFQFG